MVPESGIPDVEERVVEQAPTEEAVELEAGDPREQRDPQVTRETVEVIETAPAPRERTVPKEALDAERAKRKQAQQLYKNAEAARQRLEAEAAHRAETQRRRQSQQSQRVDWNSFKGDTNAFVEALEQRQQTRLQEVETRAAQESLRTRALLSEKYFRRDHPDYDAVMQDSGVTDRIKIHPQTGQPNDPYLHALIFAAPDPAEAGYTYARGLLAEREEAQAEQRGFARGQAETVQQVVRVADRPRGIHNLPSSQSSVRSSELSDAVIARMSEAQLREFKRKNPARYREYLENT